MKNIDPNMIRKQMNEIMSDPDKFVKATKKFPMINQFFSKIPFEGKKRIANLFKRSDLINELPAEIKETIEKILSGEFKREEQKKEPSLSISCENGGKSISEIVQKINEIDSLQIKKIHMHNPTLEDVFLFYTGKEIREETTNRTQEIKKHIQMRQLRKK
jgi:ABC-2 type transport system ATP-binding protein